MGRRSDHSRPELREIIVAEGHRQMHEVGFARFSAREVAKRIGYSIGIGFPPTWGEKTASLRPGDKTVLRPNMAFHMMTGVWKEQTGVTITQAFRVSESGHEPLTSVPRELIVKA